MRSWCRCFVMVLFGRGAGRVHHSSNDSNTTNTRPLRNCSTTNSSKKQFPHVLSSSVADRRRRRGLQEEGGADEASNAHEIEMNSKVTYDARDAPLAAVEKESLLYKIQENEGYFDTYSYDPFTTKEYAGPAYDYLRLCQWMGQNDLVQVHRTRWSKSPFANL